MYRSNQNQNQSESVKSSAKTVEEAVDQALEQLDLSRDQVDIEVISEGSRGIFGLGAEDAEVLVTPKAPASEAPGAVSGDRTSLDVDRLADVDKKISSADDAIEALETPKAEAPVSNGEAIDPAIQEQAKKSLKEILTRMSITADVSTRIGHDLVEPGETPSLTLDITGHDLGLLIGRRGETLRALQFILRQILSKEAGRWVSVVVDVESYLVRRRKSLQQLADRMADRVVFGGRKVAMEPMPAQERRIIHIQLRNHQHVYTNSVGDGDRRKVVIFPK